MHRLWTRSCPVFTVGRLRLVVLAVATTATVIKLIIAANTVGTNDVQYWVEFAQGVRDVGPVDIYGQRFRVQYNHPPLAGWMLLAINWLVDHGVAGIRFLIRVPASLADLATALLVFELVRWWRPAIEAALAAVLTVCSPVLLVVSGFHGNTDPVFVMFMLLSVYLLVVRGSAAGAGLSFATAVSIKLVPIILGPMLLVILFRMGWRRVAAFAAGCAAIFLPLWGPVVLFRWAAFKDNVLSYRGITRREWGLVQFAEWLQLPASWTETLVGPGRFVVLLLSAVLPAVVVWRRPNRSGSAVGLAMALFLLLSPAFGMQYLVWPLAAAYLVNTWAATVYNLCASVFVVVVYDHWNRAYAGRWYGAIALPFQRNELVLMTVTWAALAVVTAVGLRFGRDRGTDRTESHPRRLDERPSGGLDHEHVR